MTLVTYVLPLSSTEMQCLILITLLWLLTLLPSVSRAQITSIPIVNIRVGIVT